MFQFKHDRKKNGTGGAFWAFHFVNEKTEYLDALYALAKFSIQRHN